jgi:hypothetical protein
MRRASTHEHEEPAVEDAYVTQRSMGFSLRARETTDRRRSS